VSSGGREFPFPSTPDLRSSLFLISSFGFPIFAGESKKFLLFVREGKVR
jgi:hypothetical protein